MKAGRAYVWRFLVSELIIIIIENKFTSKNYSKLKLKQDCSVNVSTTSQRLFQDAVDVKPCDHLSHLTGDSAMWAGPHCPGHGWEQEACSESGELF